MVKCHRQGQAALGGGEKLFEALQRTGMKKKGMPHAKRNVRHPLWLFLPAFRQKESVVSAVINFPSEKTSAILEKQVLNDKHLFLFSCLTTRFFFFII
ncbi:MAG: hypothetical protein IJ521_02055, partial [Schwartzia sp.]|nr:hypothetical protein [Schwartzia sp. (in: firmicutes)]